MRLHFSPLKRLVLLTCMIGAFLSHGIMVVAQELNARVTIFCY